MKKFMIWGHKLHTHTNSYVYYGYLKAFEYLGYAPFWFDNSDIEKVKDFDFNDTIIFTEGQVDQYVPLRKDVKYILHHCNIEKYINNGCRIINLCNYLEPCERGISINYGPDKRISFVQSPIQGTVEKIKDFCFWDEQNMAVYQPWATDLLPSEIDENNPIMFNPNLREVNYIGSTNHDNIAPKFHAFAHCCQQNMKNIKVFAKVSFEENKKLIQDSYISVDIRGDWHQECGYIPCRIWKNISYGKPIGTNSVHIKNILGDHVIFNNDPYMLYFETESKYASLTKEQIRQNMLYVKENHTYINRVKNILQIWGDI